MRRVAVLPLQTVGVEAPQRARLQRAIERAARRREREVVPGHETLGATKQACRDAQPDVRCAREAGRALGVDEVLLGGAAALGPTTMIKLRLLDVAEGAVEGPLEQSARGRRRSARAAAALTRQLLPRLRARSSATPWYRRWWVWTIAVAVVAGAVAIPVTVAATRDGPREVQLP
ncbi:MAG: hypothetical protein KC503_01120 [Myxococcales bacterium]|nr:hypothetical protein [Myxococcales bacterium]